MKLPRLLAVVALAGLSSGSVLAQTISPNPPKCPGCFIVAQVDTPHAIDAFVPYGQGWGGPVIDYTGWYISGWAFECSTGLEPVRYEVTYRNDNGQRVAATIFWKDHIYRPDVQAAFVGIPCRAPAYSGFVIHFIEPIPRGTREIWITIRRGELSHEQYRVLTII